jgi:UDP:flavonoid glycosyltransferase YjiC (YdhE family)
MKPTNTYLFVLWEGGGNVPPILALARQMVQRGHRILVISDPCNEPEAIAAGCEFFSYTTAPHRYSKSADTTLLKDYAAGNTIKGFRMFLDEIACGPALNYARDVLEVLNNKKVDVVVVSEALFGGCFAAEVKNIPCIMLIPGTLTFPAPGMPPPGMLPKKGLAGKLMDKITLIVFNKLSAHGLPAFNNARKELGLVPVDNIINYVYSFPKRVLVMTSPDFEFPALFPANVRITGALLDDPYVDQTEEIILPNIEENTILIGFSTTYQNQEQLIKNVIEAIGQTSYKAIVTLGPALQEKFINVPPNVKIFSFLPHSFILSKIAAVVTHAGHGTVI